MPVYYYSNKAKFIQVQSVQPWFEKQILYLIVSSVDIITKSHFRKFTNEIIAINHDYLPIIIISELQSEKATKNNNSLLFNSSIWFRYICSEDIKAVLTQFNNEIISFQKEGLYDNPNAREYFDFQLRLQSENYLTDKAEGHGIITPFLYSDELKSYETILNINRDVLDKPEILKYHDINYNILLVDDKPDKGDLIVKLLKSNIYPNKTIWSEGRIVTRVFQSQDIQNTKNVAKTARKWISENEDSTLVFQVLSIKDAFSFLTIISESISLRFDLILMDYLLDKNKNGTREYSTLFFEWFSSKNYPEKLNLINSAKDNRGPLQKFWIFPITAFNQTFIDDLRNSNVRLIDYYWHISRGADPINTPYLFLRSLNLFLYLQLQQAVYDINTLLTFLKRAIDRLKGINTNDFQSYMGSEYAVFIQKHGWRPIICRDANSGSMFSKYIRDHFYLSPSNKYLFKLYDKMHRFFYTCSYCDYTEVDKMIHSYRELKIYLSDYWGDLSKENEQNMQGNMYKDFKPLDLVIFEKFINNILHNQQV